MEYFNPHYFPWWVNTFSKSWLPGWSLDRCKLILLNTSRPAQSGCHIADDNLKFIFLYKKCFILIEISLKLVSIGPINKKPALLWIMASHRTGDKLLSDCLNQRLSGLFTHLYVTRYRCVEIRKQHREQRLQMDKTNRSQESFIRSWCLYIGAGIYFCSYISDISVSCKDDIIV